MFGEFQEWDTIRKSVVVFGSLFANIEIGRTDSNNISQIIKVPLTYAEKDKYLQRDNNDPEIQRKFSVLLPRMSFAMGDVSYDTSRKLPSVNRTYYTSTLSNNNLTYTYTPVPYNIDFNLYVYVKNAADGTKIVENILPYFTPDYTVGVELIPQINITKDIPIVLNKVNFDDNAFGNYEELRVMVWELNFTMKTYFYGKIHDKPMIKFSTLQFHGDDIVGSPFDSVTITSNSLPNAAVLNIQSMFGGTLGGYPPRIYSPGFTDFGENMNSYLIGALSL